MSSPTRFSQTQPQPPDPADRDAMRRFESAVVEVQAKEATALLGDQSIKLPVLDLARSSEGRVNDYSNASPDQAHVACRAGCSACCYIAVSLTVPEAVLISETLRATLDEEAFRKARTRIAETSSRVSHLTLEQRAAARIPCALLGPDGACTIHPFRPIGCRGWTSFSREACEAAFESGIVGHGGPVDRITFSAAGCVTEGLQTALRAAHLDGESYEFHSAVLCAMDRASAAKEWYDGRSVFRDCQRVTSDTLAPASSNR